MREARANRPPIIEALFDPACYPHAVSRIELVETHISWVFLTGRFAYKIKKPVRLPFVDFSTLERRRRFCDDELRLNQRLAPGLYIGVVPIGGTPEAPRVGRKPAIEYAVRMRQLEQSERLDRRLATLERPDDALFRFATQLAAFHESEPALGASEVDARARLAGIAANLEQLETEIAGTTLERVLQPAADWLREKAPAQLPVIEQRIAAGRYRDCHGDLHLENLFWDDGEIVAFDALEFDRKLRCIDTMDEVAFLHMDLMAHGRDDLAWRFLTSYLESTGDYDGLAVLRLYTIHRALVRAKVAAIAAADVAVDDRVARYLELASRSIRMPRPVLVATYGLSGSGKTHLTSRLIGRLAAIRARSDLERKRLYGLTALVDTQSPPGEGIYDERSTASTYAVLGHIARLALEQGYNCIVDAALLERDRRDALRSLAQSENAAFVLLDCRASEATLRQRIQKRRASSRDASEARLDVLALQLETHEPLASEELADTVTADTDAGIDIAELAAAIEQLRSRPSATL